MKRLLTSFFLLFITIGVFCQTETVLISEKFKRVAMPKVFEILKEKYNLKVAYDYESVKEVIITKTIQSKDLKTALTTIFSDTNLEYQLTEDNRILVRRVENLTLDSSSKKSHQYIFTGKIKDSNSKTPLAYATVYCPATNEGCSTDEEGNFSLTINSNETEGTLSVQYLGYIPRVFSWTKEEKLTDLQIDLQTKSLDFAEVTIIEKLPTVSVNQADGSMVLNANQLNNLPSFGGGDVFRGLQLLPGISASDDLSSELKIRGSNGDENMVIFDGITLYKVDHFYGVFSAINPNIVNQVKVFKNAFPVEYGGRTAGVIDLASHGISEPKIGGQLQTDLLTTSAHLTLPINEKMGLLVGGRTTNKNVADTDLFSLINETDDFQNDNALTLSKINPAFKFYDFNAKWIWQISEQSTISTSYFRGYDELNSTYEIFFDTQNNRGNRRDEIKNIENLDEFAQWDNQGASLQLDHQWNSKINTNINLAYSTYSEDQFINSTLVREITRKPLPPKPGMPPITVENTRIDTALTLTNSFSNTIKGTELNIKNALKVDEKQQLVFGYHLVNNEVTSDLMVDNRNRLSQDLTGSQHSGYLQYNLKGVNKFNLGLGLRSTYYTITQKNYLSPRISLTYEASEQLHLKASGSQYYQFLRTNEREDRFGKSYDYWVLSTDKIGASPVASSQQGMLGFNLKNDDFELDVEAYYKKMDGVTEFAPTANGFLTDLVNTSSNKLFEFYNGTGVSKGIDILLKKSAGNYTGWLSYTLSKTTHSFPKIDNGNPFPSLDDRRHQIKWVNQYRYKKFDFSAVYVFSSGRAYTDLTIIDGQQDRRLLTANDRISYLKDYIRLDISAGYKFNIGPTKARVGASIFNVLNRENVKYKQYIRSIPNERGDNNQPINQITGIEALMLGFTPNISFSIDF